MARDDGKVESIATLRDVYGIVPGTRVYTIVTHVARSGMSRRIRLFVIKDGEPHSITWHVAKILGWRLDSKGNHELVVHGCGMDMGFHTVYHLGRAMFPDGGPIEASTRRHSWRGDDSESDGGYLLDQVWL